MSCTSVGKMIQEKFNEFKGEKKKNHAYIILVLPYYIILL
jgi:hypothetical protein